MNRVVRKATMISTATALLASMPMFSAVTGASALSTGYAKTISTSKPTLNWKGTITFFAQSYTPVGPGIKKGQNQTPLHELYKLAQQFEAMNPGIKIQFVDPSFGDTNQQVMAKAAAGTMYDIYFNQYENFNSVFPQGIVEDLNPYLNKPNPYVPGNKQWKSVMNPKILTDSQAPGGQMYEINGDYVGVEFFYNKNLYKKAGITTPPKTWTQLVLDAKKLKAHGINPGADEPVYDWWVRIFLGNYLGLPTLEKIASFDGQPGISQLDNAIAYNKGILDPSKNPRIMAWWPVVKQLYDTWDPNVTAIPWDNIPTGAPTGINMFSAGKIATAFQGTWVPNSIKGADHGKIPFQLGSFLMPSLKGTSKYATPYNSSGDAGGPQAAFQYAISTPKADQSMGQTGKLDACVAWLQFITTPQHEQSIVNESGSFVPTFKGTKAVSSLRSVQGALNQPWYQEDGGQFFTAKEYTTIRNLFQQYLTGHLSLADATQQYKQAVDQAFHQFVLQQHVNLSKY